MRGLPIARIVGIEIRVQLGWVFVVAMVAALAVIQVSGTVPSLGWTVQWILGGVVGIAFFASALLHDLGHALVARRRGIVVESILVSFFGGATPADPSSTIARDDLAIAASGPLVSTILGLALGAIGLGIGTFESDLAAAIGEILALLGALNLLVGLVNLIPAYPLDGGRIVRALAWWRSGSLARGWRAAATSGRLAGLVLLVLAAGLLLSGDVANGAMLGLSGWFLVLSSRAIRERQRVDSLIGTLVVSDAMERSQMVVSPHLTVDTLAGQLIAKDSETTAVPVSDGASIVGMLGVRDVRRLRRSAWTTTRVGDVMAKPPKMVVLQPDLSLIAGLEQLQRTGLDGLPVLDGADLVGVLTRRSAGEAARHHSAATDAASASTDTAAATEAARRSSDD
ncbi:MAG: site-2 protease family protein [Candidatus Limnocylindrales bacterium]